MTKTLEELVLGRLRQSESAIRYCMRMAKLGNPFAGEPDFERRMERLQTKVNLSPSEAKVVDFEVRRRAKTKMFDKTLANARVEGAGLSVSGQSLTLSRVANVVSPQACEKVWGDSVDFASGAFLQRGAQIARSVARVSFNANTRGSGVLIGNGLFLTTHHVIETAQQAEHFCLEFDYECDLKGAPRRPTRFKFDPSFFITSPASGLDFTIIGVGEVIDGPERLESFGCLPLSCAKDKHMVGEFANIVQHRAGRYKEVVLRENRLVNRLGDCLHYVGEIESGSPGSPVFNSEWQLIAMHHWGGPLIEGGPATDGHSYEINEGIRISSIVRNVQSRMGGLAGNSKNRINSVMDCENSWVPPLNHLAGPNDHVVTSPVAMNETKIASTHHASLALPVEITIKIPSQIPGQPGLTENIRVSSVTGKPESAQKATKVERF